MTTASRRSAIMRSRIAQGLQASRFPTASRLSTRMRSTAGPLLKQFTAKRQANRADGMCVGRIGTATQQLSGAQHEICMNRSYESFYRQLKRLCRLIIGDKT